MIYKKTKMLVIDNSGASVVKCIHVLKKGQNKGYSIVGQIVKVAIKRLKKSIPKKKVKKSEVLNGLIVYQRSMLNRTNNLCLRGSQNYIVLLNKEMNNIISSRIILPVCVEIRKTEFSKLLSLSPMVL